MLDDAKSLGNEKQDFRDMGLLALRLMELGTSLTKPGLFELQHPEEWGDGIKAFLRKTQDCSGETIQQVKRVPPESQRVRCSPFQDVFLEQSPGSHCFKPLVLLTARSIHRDWKCRMK